MSLWSYQAPPELSDEEYARWKNLLEERTGISFLQHKSILQKGLSQRMREVGAENYNEYFDQVSAVPEGAVEWARLVDRVSVKETSFFREPLSYEACKKFLLRRLIRAKDQSDYTLDIWSVGCSTGEEPYSLAMMANDLLGYMGMQRFWGVIATDISPTALNIARAGIYSARKVNGLPVTQVEKYFVNRSDNEFEISADLKQRVCFAQRNMLDMDDAPMVPMDVIYCQNVLVYFSKENKSQVLNSLVEYLKPGGMLMIGPGEIIGWSHPSMTRLSNDSVLAFVKSK